MFRFTIRDMLWLTAVIALSIALWIEHRRFTAAYFALHEQQAEIRMADLRAKELRGEVILPASPGMFETLERRSQRSRAIDE